MLNVLEPRIVNNDVRQIINKQKGILAATLCLCHLKKNDIDLAYYYYGIAVNHTPKATFDLFQQEIFSCQEKYTRIKKSRAYRLGEFLLYPFRRSKRFISKI